jgi:diadenosine tetraphosphatase ApaH/serine/threonine PP2A family protein phosphatase
MKAIVSDIHANMPAADAVMADLRSHGVRDEDIICLGDIVGYGPQPCEAVDLCMTFRVNLMGNHDEAVIYEPMGFNFRALSAIRWTKKKLEPGLFAFANKRRLQFLRDLKITYREDNAFFVHGSPREPTTEYILKGDVEDANVGRNVGKLKDIFDRFDSLCVVGHTHIPCVIMQVPVADAPLGFRYLYSSEKDAEYKFRPEPGSKYVINAGAVGQPRDGDTRACYLLWDKEANLWTWRRVEYDVKKTVAMIRKAKDLDDYNADRLEMGI